MKEHAPSTERNRDDILAALRDVLPSSGTVLEIASGTGQHAVYFAPRLPGLTWQPTDRTPETLASICAWRDEHPSDNLLEPLELDVTSPDWPVGRVDAVVNINMLHISPWEACEGLFAGAARVLPEGAPLVYYGAFIRDDRDTAPSNLEFDEDLRERDERWGVRRLEDVMAVAERCGLPLAEVRDMPNNNYVAVFRRAASG